MTAAHSRLLPQHDVFPKSPRVKRYTLVAFAAACGLTAIVLGAVGSDTVALVIASGVLLFMAWRASESDRNDVGHEKPRD